jgi:hypothetical protein
VIATDRLVAALLTLAVCVRLDRARVASADDSSAYGYVISTFNDILHDNDVLHADDET